MVKSKTPVTLEDPVEASKAIPIVKAFDNARATMRIHRRQFIAITGAATLGLTLSDIKLVAKPRRLPKIPTIAQIVAASWDASLKEMRGGNPWNSHVLNRWTTKGRIKIVPLPLGEHVAIEDNVPGYWHLEDKVYVASDSTYNLPRTISSLTQYDIEHAHIPVTWTKNDEQKQDTKEKRIAFCTALIKNVVYSAEDYLEMQAKKRKANLIVSQDYRLARSDVYQVMNQSAYYFLVSTAMLYVPQSVDLNRVKILTA